MMTIFERELVLCVSPAQGKFAAVRAYCDGLLTLEACQRLFSKHPEWRTA
jgi:hypothetical protein